MDRKHTFVLLCVVRKSRLNRQQKYPVYLRISVDTKRVEVATKVNITMDEWDVHS
ncbi:Arm DNA-binding domain-containing protein [Pinibacter soli]|uniref:Arm DNA-binding domain-containing protein n=1 Tax=Pinibacter soli TaxID=3044211 RepID=A0ABT6RB89_9BACT|nr:Arm DNA-binding domain-containing protein [Pinibacter soli]MDI3319808.1 Arm DNA-binding domain-containing protein [Pinibacter soli]